MVNGVRNSATITGRKPMRRHFAANWNGSKWLAVGLGCLLYSSFDYFVWPAPHRAWRTVADMKIALFGALIVILRVTAWILASRRRRLLREFDAPPANTL